MPRRLTRLCVALAVFLVAGSAAGSMTLRRSLELNISRANGSQVEATIAVHPRNPRILLAGSNSENEAALRTYSSTDGGRTWSSEASPATFPGDTPNCAIHPLGDPAVGIDGSGRQYVGFLGTDSCSAFSRLFVASRPGPETPWSTPVELVRAEFEFAVDKPVLAVDASASSRYDGRVYVVFQGRAYHLALVWSDDSGQSWSAPHLLKDDGYLASIAVDDQGSLYATWLELGGVAVVTRSTDGGVHFEPEQAFHRFVRGQSWELPAQRSPRATPLPMLAVDNARARVYISFADKRRPGQVDVYVQPFSTDLTPIGGARRVARLPHRPADRFLPAIAVDEQTGAVWVCYYDTAGSRRREGARFTCTRSNDRAVTWQAPIRAATRFSYEVGHSVRTVAERRFGDYEGVVAAGGNAHPIWTDGRLLGTRRREEIFTATLR